MMKQKLALLLSTVFLMATVVLPGLTFARNGQGGGETQSGTLELTGIFDVWANNYSETDGVNLSTIEFADADGTTSLTTSALAQDTFKASATDNTLDANDFIGIINSQNNISWELTVEVQDDFTGASTGATIDPSNLKIATVANETQVPSLDVTHNGTAITLSRDALTGLFYYVNPTYYTYTPDDFTVYTNSLSGDLDSASTYANDLSTTKTIFLNQMTLPDNEAYGIFATGVSYFLKVPGNTPADTYSATLLYTASIVG